MSSSINPQNNRDLNKVFSTLGPNLVTLAWTGDELSRGQTWWWTDGQTQTTTIPGGQFPHSAFARGPRSPAFEERMRAATGERSAGSPPYPVWHVYWFLLISTRDINLCHNFYSFTADDNHLQKSTILSSVICRYTGHQQPLHVWSIFF